MTPALSRPIGTSADRYAYPFVIGQLVIFFFSGILETVGINLPARPYVILSSIHALLFFPYLMRIVANFFLQAPGKLSLLAAYFFIHPLLVMFCHAIGSRQFPQGTNDFSLLYSSVSWILGGITFMVAARQWTDKEKDRFLDALWKIGFFVACEALIIFYLFRQTPLFALGTSGTGRFQSLFVYSNFICGYLGFYLYGLSLYRIVQSSTRPVNRLAMIFGVLLVLASIERSVILGFIVFNIIVMALFLIRGWRLEQPEKKVVHGLCLGILLFFSVSAVVGASVTFRSGTLHNYESILDRVMMWTRGTEMALQYFPLGVGGSQAGIYVTSGLIKPTLSNLLIESVPNKEIVHQFNITQGVIEHKHYGDRRSLHSTQLELFSEFGLFGLIVILLMVLYPVVSLMKFGTRLSRSRDPNLFAGTIFSGFLLSLQLPLMAVSAGSAIIWITLLLYLFSYQKHYIPMRKMKSEG